MKVISKGKIPIKNWAVDIESGAVDQALNLSNLPFAFKHIALMPDAHQGYGMPIGGVMATKGMVIPNAVGVDIGCGMRAVKTNLKSLDKINVKEIMGLIREKVPVGKMHHKESQVTTKDLLFDTQLIKGRYEEGGSYIFQSELASATKQIGTLGGGNHFIEIQKGSDGHIWFMIHCGSRNVGLQVATHYNKVAKALNEIWCSSVPKSWDLAHLPVDSKEGVAYYYEMSWCNEFARANRFHIMLKVQEAFNEVFGGVDFNPSIDVSHNYAAIENHFGQNVMIHRKGATRAYANEYCIIPGSQGTASYICIGKGNPESFKSCSHGAGRKMGRRQARDHLDLEREKARLDDKGIVHSIRSSKDLDEAAGAYKNILTVMKAQKDLVDIDVKLEPLGVVKG